MLYEALFRGLHVARVRYLLVGAVAINLHGVPRMTADLDLMVDLAESNLRTFVQTMTALGYIPRVPVQATEILDPAKRREWKDTKSMIVFTWIRQAQPYEEVDIFLDNLIDFGPAYANRKEIVVGDFTIPLAGVSDLDYLEIALQPRAGPLRYRSPEADPTADRGVRMIAQWPTRRRGGFAYRVTDAQIRRWQAMPPEAKLQWLEDANRLLEYALSPQAKAIRDRFRLGQL